MVSSRLDAFSSRLASRAAGLDARERKQLAFVAAFAIGLTSLALRQLVPPFVIANAEYDDQLFARTSDSLYNGHWLGRYNPKLTLSKGIGYPAFLAACRHAGISVLLCEQFLLLTAAGLLGLVVFRVTRSTFLALSIFGLIAMDPSFLGPSASRITRDNWYASTSLLLFALAALLMVPISASRSPRAAAGMLARWLSGGAASGLVLALYWMGREERPWLLPALLLLVVGSLARRRWFAEAAETQPGVGGWWLGAAAFCVTAGLVATIAVQGVEARNEQHYGVRLTNDFTEGAFGAAFGAWQAVHAGSPRQYVPINNAQRAAVYAVSPASRELQPYIEGPRSAGLRQSSCHVMDVCDDIAGGWTPWVMRQAVDLTGKYDNAAAAQAFYVRLNSEIRTACEQGRLSCGRVMPSLLPQPDNVRGGAYVSSLWRAGLWLVRFHLGDQQPVRSVGSVDNWKLFARLPGIPTTVAQENRNEEQGARYSWILSLLRFLYGLAIPVLFFPALAGVFIAPLWRGGGWFAPWVMAVAAGTAVIVRLALLALVDSTSFYASKGSYSLAADAPLLAFVMLGCWLLITARREPRIPVAAGRVDLSAIAPAASPDEPRGPMSLAAPPGDPQLRSRLQPNPPSPTRDWGDPSRFAPPKPSAGSDLSPTQPTKDNRD